LNVERTTRVPAPPEEVWARVTSVEGVNDELRPWLRMTVPRGWRGATLDDLPLGRRVGRSWVLLGGVVPVDYDDLTLVEVEPGRRFLERSPMGSMRSWQHERVVRPAGDGACELTDRLRFEPRLPGTARLSRAIVERLFAHRHRRLLRRFGER
jgi:ligand-binding SRPBCC domain-containing protein